MSARDLAIGLLLGGGGGGTVDKTFHEILDHTRYVCEKEFSQGYKFKGGMWEQQGIMGNISAHLGEFNELRLYGSDTQGNYNAFVNNDPACYTLVPVMTVFKDDAPIYAIVPNVNEIFTSMKIKLSPKFSFWSLRDREIYYMSKGDYRIDSFNITGEIYAPSVYSQHWADYRVSMSLSGTVTYSYQPYTIDDTGGEPQLIPDGNRVTSTFSNGSGGQLPYTSGRYVDIYSDLSNDDLYWEFHNVYDSMYEYLNLPTYPVEVYLPS